MRDLHSPVTVGLVATVADAEGAIEQFVRYHLAIGFSRLYIFVDDASPKVASILSTFPEVEYYLPGDELLQLWMETPVYQNQTKRALIDKEVMVRQEMNFYCAYDLAKRAGVNWLLHIDLDELFYPNQQSVAAHFSALQREGISCITYLNYECLPDFCEDGSIYSSEIFKINFFRHKHWIFSRSQRDFIKNNSWLKEKFFNYYQNGKSAVNTFAASPKVYDVHSILVSGRRQFGRTDDPIILHFPCATLASFTKKYQRLGNFSNEWMGYSRAGAFLEETHLHARDLFQAGADASAIRRFYMENFCLSEEKRNALFEQGMLLRIDFHKNFSVLPKSSAHC